ELDRVLETFDPLRVIDEGREAAAERHEPRAHQLVERTTSELRATCCGGATRSDLGELFLLRVDLLVDGREPLLHRVDGRGRDRNGLGGRGERRQREEEERRETKELHRITPP